MVNLSAFYVAVVLLWGFRLRVVPLSLSPSCVTHYKTSSEHLFSRVTLNGPKALANEDTLLPTQVFPRLPARATFVADTNFVSGTQNMLLILFKAAKYEIQKLATCRATLFRCKFFGRCYAFFNLLDQLDPQQKHSLRIEEMRRADWLICRARANLLPDKL